MFTGLRRDLGLLALALTLGASQLALGNDLEERLIDAKSQDGHVNRAIKADRSAPSARGRQSFDIEIRAFNGVSFAYRVAPTYQLDNAFVPRQTKRNRPVACDGASSFIFAWSTLWAWGKCLT